MDKDADQVEQGRFDVVFTALDELRGSGGDPDTSAAEIRESEGIDELRRLSAAFAEVPRVSYTTTTQPIRPTTS
jgi:hypothetical protein